MQLRPCEALGEAPGHPLSSPKCRSVTSLKMGSQVQPGKEAFPAEPTVLHSERTDIPCCPGRPAGPTGPGDGVRKKKLYHSSRVTVLERTEERAGVRGHTELPPRAWNSGPKRSACLLESNKQFEASPVVRPMRVPLPNPEALPPWLGTSQHPPLTGAAGQKKNPRLCWRYEVICFIYM